MEMLFILLDTWRTSLILTWYDEQKKTNTKRKSFLNKHFFLRWTYFKDPPPQKKKKWGKGERVLIKQQNYNLNYFPLFLNEKKN